MPLFESWIHRSRLEAQLSVDDLPSCLEVIPSGLAAWEHDLEAPARENFLRLSLQFADLLPILEGEE